MATISLSFDSLGIHCKPSIPVSDLTQGLVFLLKQVRRKCCGIVFVVVVFVVVVAVVGFFAFAFAFAFAFGKVTLREFSV